MIQHFSREERNIQNYSQQQQQVQWKIKAPQIVLRACLFETHRF